MDLRSLRYFVAVVDAGSLTRAAGGLHVAQPALTAQLKRLEDELGVQLLERSHAGVRPTAAGEQLYHDATRLVADAEALRRRIGRPPGEPTGSVTLGFPLLLTPVILGRMLLRLRERHPRIRVFVIDDVSLAVRDAVQDGRADFGLLVDAQSSPGLSLRPVATEALYLAGLDRDGSVRKMLRPASTRPRPRPRPRPGTGTGAGTGTGTGTGVTGARIDDGTGAADVPRADEPTIRFADAARLPLVMQSRRFPNRRLVEQAAASLGLRLNVLHEHDSATVLRALQRAGAAFAISPGCAVPLREADPALVRARVVEPEIRRTYSIAWLTGRQPTGAARAVVALLREEIAAAIGEGSWIATHVDDADHQIL